MPRTSSPRKSGTARPISSINDYQKLRALYGQLLAEVQRITSEGDYEAAKALIETYGVQIDPVLHKEVLDRYAKLNLAPYTGFVNPVYTPVVENGKIVDVKVEYPRTTSSRCCGTARSIRSSEARTAQGRSRTSTSTTSRANGGMRNLFSPSRALA